MNPITPTSECFTDYAIQEFVAGRLDVEVRKQLAAHLETCVECRQAQTEFLAEFRILRSALTPRNPQAHEESIPDETLGLYLAGALGDLDASKLEALLTTDSALLGRLIALQGELEAVRGGALPTMTDVASKGEILRMPRRVRPTITILNDRLAIGDQGR